MVVIEEFEVVLLRRLSGELWSHGEQDVSGPTIEVALQCMRTVVIDLSIGT